MKTDISLRLRLSLSKIVGTVVSFSGCYGFIFTDTDPIHSIAVITLGLSAIGVKQYFVSKSKSSTKTTSNEGAS